VAADGIGSAKGQVARARNEAAEASPAELSQMIARLPGAQTEGFFDISWATSN